MTVQNAVPTAHTDLTTTTQWEELFLAMGIGDGVAGAPNTTDLKASLNSGARTVIMQPGYAVIRGRLWGTDATDATAVAAASAHDRVDRLVLRLNRTASTAATDIQPVVITGTPSDTPAPPAIKNNDAQFQDLLIAQWVSKADGSFTTLIDYRQFCGSGVIVCTASTRPLNPPRPMLAIETTGALVLWNGSNWNYITPSFGQDTDTLEHDFELSADGSILQVATVSFTGDGITQAEITFSVPGFWRPVNSANQESFNIGSGIPQALLTCYHGGVVQIRIDGNIVDQRWFGVDGNAGDSVRVAGMDMRYKTSDVAHTTPSAGDHIVNIKAWQTAGNRDIRMVGDPSFPIRLHVAPVFE